MTADEREQNRRNFIADAIEVLNRSLDYRETLRSLAEIAVPRIADWCAVDIVDGGILRRLGSSNVGSRRFARTMRLPHSPSRRRSSLTSRCSTSDCR